MTEPVVTLNEAKEALRILHDDQDALIQGFLDAAIEEALCLADGLDRETLTAETLPPTVRTAILLHVIQIFDQADGQTPPGSVALASRHRDWSA
ncbi:MAG: head-tail connector protein [Caulobacteraceae bacterium]|nr:head-tail connector protein [Caulobacteraceae bacterium]